VHPSRAEQRVRQFVKAGLHIAVVVPCYNVQEHIREVVHSLPDYVQHIILVNDASRDKTGEIIDQLADARVTAIHLPRNSGVGGAMLAGFAQASATGADIIVKMDGDGQMDPVYLAPLIEPLMLGKADYTKGNRFRSMASLAEMPMLRRIGNAALSFLAKLASGYWNIFDPTNGYLAARRETLELLPTHLIHRRYFFEHSMLIALGIIGAVVVDVPMFARYGTEKTNLRISRVLFEFPWHLVKGFLRRIWLRKVLYSLTMEAILGFFGVLFILVGGTFGLIELVHYAIKLRTPAPAGTVMTAALPIFLGFQMVINAILLDVQSVPAMPLCEKLSDQSLLEASNAVSHEVNLSGGCN
jgi:dolichol-phosphate mannosyltransferase